MLARLGCALSGPTRRAVHRRRCAARRALSARPPSERAPPIAPKCSFFARRFVDGEIDPSWVDLDAPRLRVVPGRGPKCELQEIGDFGVGG
jgi:hypothetical protein